MDTVQPGTGRDAGDVADLRRGIRDLVALSTLPALWTGRNPAQIAGSLAEALLSALCIDLVYVCLSGEPDAIEAVRAAGHPEMAGRAAEIGRALAPWLRSAPSTGAVELPHPAGGVMQGAAKHIGFGGRWGQVVVCARRSAFPTELEKLLLSVGANQAAIALQEASVQAALRESEARHRRLSEELEHRVHERTAELTRTVDALNAEVVQREQAERTSRAQARTLIRTTEQLTQDHPLEEFPRLVLAAIVDQLDAAGGSLWSYDELTEVAELVLELEGGRVLRRRRAGRPRKPERVVHRGRPGWEGKKRALLRGECLVVSDPETDPFLDGDTRAFLSAMGTLTLLVCPMLLQGRLTGYCRLHSTRREEYGPRDLELAQALTHQATLAMQWTRLAGQAREAAVLHEREQAAAARVAELDRANQALLHTLDALADAPELQRFLGTVLAAITEQLGAASSALFLVDEVAGTMHLELAYEEGRVIPASETGFPSLTMTLAAAAGDPQWTSLIRERRTILDGMETIGLLSPANRDFLIAQGVKRVVAVPLALGDEVVGVLSVRLTDAELIPDEKIALAHALAHQATLAIQMARLAEQARQTAILEERTRMAGEIHDGLGQAFTGILLQLGALELLPADRSAQERALLESARDLARDGLTEARRSAHALRPQVLEQMDLAAALQRMTEQMSTDLSTSITFRLHGSPRPLRPDVADHLLRIGQEALTNALHHGQARAIGVEITFAEAALRLCVTDDGRGFAVGSPLSTPGFGLSGMRERANLIGAALDVTSEPGRGTRVEVNWRFPPGEPNEKGLRTGKSRSSS